MYQYGPGVPIDVSRAIALYRQACDMGNTNGCQLWAAATVTNR